MRRRPPHSIADGFTLVEVLIALTLSSVLAVLLFSGLHTYVLAANTGYKHLDNLQASARTTAFLRSQLREMVPLTLSGQRRQRQVLFSGNTQRLAYIGNIPSHRSPGGLHHNTLTIDDNGIGAQVTFAYQRLLVAEDFTYEAFIAHAPANKRVLFEDLDDASLEYYGAATDDAPAAWSSQWQRVDKLPSLVRLRLSFVDDPAPHTLIFSIHATTPSRHFAHRIGGASRSRLRGLSAERRADSQPRRDDMGMER